MNIFIGGLQFFEIIRRHKARVKGELPQTSQHAQNVRLHLKAMPAVNWIAIDIGQSSPQD
jgi:hypothetical protein